jgi:hypothetical protein
MVKTFILLKILWLPQNKAGPISFIKGMETFKEEDLLLYLYQESPKATTQAIHTALEEGNYALEEQLKTLRRSIAQLSALQLKRPSPFSLKEIKNYSQKAAD